MPRVKTDSKRINMYLPNRLINAGKALAERQGISFSQLTRIALKDYIIKALKEGNTGS
jgi:predicted DNA binding CopG/RHH family protein